jgi:hypothetical protein
VVSGYALGEYDEATLSYRVRAVNAHTWVEVYFPDYGWIHFEPTQTIPVAERPTSGSGDLSSVVNEALAPDPQSLLPPEELEDVERADGLLTEGLTGDSAGGPFGLVWWQLAVGAVLLLIAAITLYAGAKYNSRVEGDVDRSFTRLGNWSRWLGIPWRATQTPYEQADSLVAVVPEGQKPVRSLTRQYVLSQFSPAKSIEDDFDPRLEWRQLRPLLIKKRIVQSLNRRRQAK